MRYFLMGLVVVLACVAGVLAVASGFAWLCTGTGGLGKLVFSVFIGFFGLLTVGMILLLAYETGQSIRDRFEDGLGFRLFGWRFEVRDERGESRYLASRKWGDACGPGCSGLARRSVARRRPNPTHPYRDSGACCPSRRQAGSPIFGRWRSLQAGDTPTAMTPPPRRSPRGRGSGLAPEPHHQLRKETP